MLASTCPSARVRCCSAAWGAAASVRLAASSESKIPASFCSSTTSASCPFKVRTERQPPHPLVAREADQLDALAHLGLHGILAPDLGLEPPVAAAMADAHDRATRSP